MAAHRIKRCVAQSSVDEFKVTQEMSLGERGRAVELVARRGPKRAGEFERDRRYGSRLINERESSFIKKANFLGSITVDILEDGRGNQRECPVSFKVRRQKWVTGIRTAPLVLREAIVRRQQARYGGSRRLILVVYFDNDDGRTKSMATIQKMQM